MLTKTELPCVFNAFKVRSKIMNEFFATHQSRHQVQGLDDTSLLEVCDFTQQSLTSITGKNISERERTGILNYLKNNKNESVFYRQGNRISVVASGEVFDVSFMVAGPALVLRVPLLVYNREDQAHCTATINSLVEHIKAQKEISSVVVDVHENETSKMSYLETQGFQRFCSWFSIPAGKLNLPERVSILTEQDAQQLAEITHQVRLNRQAVCPQFWSISAHAIESHVPYLKEVIRKPGNICYGVRDQQGTLEAFAIGTPYRRTFPISHPTGVPLADVGEFLFDDFQVRNPSDTRRLMFGLLSGIVSVSKEVSSLTRFNFVCSIFDRHTIHFVTEIGAEAQSHWYIRSV